MTEHLDDPELEQFIHQKVMKALSKIHRRLDMIETAMVMNHLTVWAAATGVRTGALAKPFAQMLDGWKQAFPEAVEDLEHMKAAAIQFGNGPDEPADSGPGVAAVNTRINMLEYVWMMSHVGGLSGATGQKPDLLAKTISGAIDSVRKIEAANPTAIAALDNMRAHLKQVHPKA